MSKIIQGVISSILLGLSLVIMKAVLSGWDPMGFHRYTGLIWLSSIVVGGISGAWLVILIDRPNNNRERVVGRK